MNYWRKVNIESNTTVERKSSSSVAKFFEIRKVNIESNITVEIKSSFNIAKFLKLANGIVLLDKV